MIFHITIVVLLSWATIIEGNQSGCGVRPSGARVGRLISGRDATPNSWPWMVSVQKNGNHWCGGVLINNRWVLTAAHCVYENMSPSAYTAVLGAHNLKGTTRYQQKLKVIRVVKNRDFITWNMQHDIALLQLEKTVQLSAHINVPCLPNSYVDARPGARCYVTGWGRILGGKTTDTLKQIDVPIVDINTCANRNNAIKRMDKNLMLCAGQGGRGICKGDGGGPLVCNESGKWVLRGIASWTHPYCYTSYYSVFTRFSRFVGWMNNELSKWVPVTGPCVDKSSCRYYLQSHCESMSWPRKNCPKKCGLC